MVGRVTERNIFSRKVELLWEIAVGQESHQGIGGMEVGERRKLFPLCPAFPMNPHLGVG